MSRPRQVSDEEILEVARACFLDDPNASTVTIAERVGLSQASLFKRFGTKMRLLLASMGVEQAPPWTEICQRGPDARPMPEQLHEIGTELAAFFRWMVPRVAVMKSVGVDFRKMFGDVEIPPPVRGYEALRGWFARAVDQGLIRPGEPGELALSYIGMFQGRAFWRHIAGSYVQTPLMDDAAYVRHAVDLFWRGVTPEEASR